MNIVDKLLLPLLGMLSLFLCLAATDVKKYVQQELS